jgi:pimeloyl-ACP methyl ester carboxylesterase
MPLVETSNGALFYADHRDPTAHLPVTLLIHGAGGSHLDWPAELRRLPEANCIAADLPGHGRSAGAGRGTVAAYAADMAALLDALKIGTAFIAGHSMGGAVALTLALHYPDRVRGLILIGTGAKLGVSAELLAALRDDRPQALAFIIQGYWGDAPEYDQQRRLSLKRLSEVAPEVLLHDFIACSQFDVRALLPRLQKPALIIGGTADTMTPFKYSSYLHEQIAGSELVRIEGGHHMMLLQQPVAVAEAVKSWLAVR